VALRSPAPAMIRVAAGVFRMGSSATEVVEAAAACVKEPLGHRCNETTFADELSQHWVTLSSYWLDRTEVTVADYRRCVALQRCAALPYAEGARRFDRPRLPASFVSHADARSYCEFRGARLPTEAEFERAARGTRGRSYPWGELFNSRAANHGRLGHDDSGPPGQIPRSVGLRTDASDGFAEIAPAGAFPAGRTPDGFLDLAGNVAEWVSDRYLPSYPEAHVRNPSGPASPPASSERVVRGGHYADAAPWLRGAARAHAEPTQRSPFVGFRCARSVARRARERDAR
jgi:formylglycine-generating enzyme